MKEFLLGNLGNTDDIRCSIRLMNPGTEKDILDQLDYLERSLAAERKNYNRFGVVKMIESKIRKLQKELKKLNIEAQSKTNP